MKKIILTDVQHKKYAVNKTMSGGFGHSSQYYSKTNFFIWLLKKIKKKGVRVPLIEFAYLTKYFKKKGYDVEIIYGEEIKKADIFIIYGSLVEFDNEIKYTKKIRKTYPDVRIGFIGTFPSINTELYLKYSDFVISGEIESFIVNNKEEIEKLSGNIKNDNLKDLDIVDSPDWSEYELNSFAHKPFFGNRKFIPMYISKGCPMTCSYYCAYPIISGKIIRKRNIDKVINEIKKFISDYDIKAILFRDPIFTINRENTVEFCNKLISESIKIKWACETHPEYLDEELLELMYKSGNVAITIGVESRNEEVIKTSKRFDVSEKKLTKIVNYAENIGIKIMAGYIIGSENDTEKSILETIDYSIGLNTSFAQFSVSTPYPGTQFYKDIYSRIVEKDWTKFGTSFLVYTHKHLTNKKIEELKKKAYMKYYFRLEWMLKFIKGRIHGIFNGR